MRVLTEHCPKPLLNLAGKPIIVRLIENLRLAGLTELVINHAWQGHRLVEALGDGERYGVHIEWSAESAALETAGGIANALPLLGNEPFAVVNGDIATDFDFATLCDIRDMLVERHLAAGCVLVDNPSHHPNGDFGIDANGLMVEPAEGQLRHTYTFAGIGVYQPTMFTTIAAGQRAALGPLLRQCCSGGRVIAHYHEGTWSDIGTPERLEQAASTLYAATRENSSRFAGH